MVEAMEIQEGFKQTEVGVIPSDWGIKKLKDIAPLQRGFDLPNSKLINGKYPVVYSNGIINYHNKYQAKGPGVVTGRSGTIGKVHYIQDNYWPHNTSLWVTDFKNNNPLFIYYLYLCIKIDRFSSGSGVPTLNRNDVHDYKVAIPTKAEQTAIARALNDADALITQLEKLIAKKRAIKQGVMQELLTGKKRLMGFNGKWDIKTLGDVCDIKTGKKDVNQGNPNGYYPFFTCSRESTYSDEYSFDGEAILIAGNGEVGNLHYYVGKFEAYQRTYVLQNFTVGTNYLWYQLLAFFKKSLGIGTIGSSIPYIKIENIAEFIFSTPKEESEQTAIAQILSDMDAEIEILEKKLDKHKMLKQGMMQNLLTGRIRLI